jgi:hypothetical protein
MLATANTTKQTAAKTRLELTIQAGGRKKNPSAKKIAAAVAEPINAMAVSPHF